MDAAVSLRGLWQRPRRVAAAQLNAQAVGERLVWDALTLVAQARAAHAEALIADRRLQLHDRESPTSCSGWQASPRRACGPGTSASWKRGRRAATRLASRSCAGPSSTTGISPVSRWPRPSDSIWSANSCGPSRVTVRRPCRVRHRSRATRGCAGLPARRACRGDRHRGRRATSPMGAFARGHAASGFSSQWTGRRGVRARTRRGCRRAALLAQPGWDRPRRRGSRAGEPAIRRGQSAGRERRPFRRRARAAGRTGHQRVARRRSCRRSKIEQRQAESAYQAGEIPLFTLLDVSRRLVDGRMRLLDAEADLQRATIALERSIGRSCGQR